MDHLWIKDILLVIFLATASVWDCRSRRIPNWLTLGGGAVAAVFVFFAWTQGTPAGQFTIGMVIAVGSMLLLYLGGGVGGGDVKLMIAVGLLSGYPDIIRHLFYGALVALALILFRLGWRGETLATLKELIRAKPKIIHDSPETRAETDEKVLIRSTSFALAFLIAVVWGLAMTVW